MNHSLRITLAQLNFLVGDIEGNTQKIIKAIAMARDIHQANLIVFPELVLTGYPPEDLLYRADFHARVTAALSLICKNSIGIDVILGYPALENNYCYNRASLIQQQQITHTYDKQCLPNYGVFDEQRYFKAGKNSCVANINGINIGILICEDLWHPEPTGQLKSTNTDLIIAINASPFSKNKSEEREQVLCIRIQESGLPIAYVNCVGGQDELLFDGGSMVLDHKGNLIQQTDFFEENLLTFTVKKNVAEPLHIETSKSIAPSLSEEARIYKALVLGVQDYVRKNGFTRVLLGLSGGIDSALTLAIAVDALEKENVQAIIMPSRYSADISLTGAKEQVETMGVEHEILSIEPIFQAFLETLTPVFKNLPEDITEENLQARCRGTLLMAIANKKNAMVLTTSNKSETAVGYSTLYGDMAGGFCVLKDVFKTMVYRLAHYRNQLNPKAPVIPNYVITRAPSAELSHNQKDEDSLPPYPILDEILTRYTEHNESAEGIIQAGFDAEIVHRVLTLVNRSEYKRRQSAPGTRVSGRAFGKDWRCPITSK